MTIFKFACFPVSNVIEVQFWTFHTVVTFLLFLKVFFVVYHHVFIVATESFAKRLKIQPRICSFVASVDSLTCNKTEA